MKQLDPTDWIDAQREAGNTRGNIFSDILAAVRQKREAGYRQMDALYERRSDRVETIRSSAARDDAAVDLNAAPGRVPSFAEMQARLDAV